MTWFRLTFSCFVALIILSIPVNAQNNTTRFFYAYDYENLTVDDTAGGVFFDITKTPNAQLVTFTVACASGTDCPVRFVYDGTTTVTTSVGQRLVYGDSVALYGNPNIKNFRAIREGATSAVLNVMYHR